MRKIEWPLLPCLRCKSENVTIIREEFPPVRRGPVAGYSVQCGNCACRSLPSHSRRDAAARWNGIVSRDDFEIGRDFGIFVPDRELKLVKKSRRSESKTRPSPILSFRPADAVPNLGHPPDGKPVRRRVSARQPKKPSSSGPTSVRKTLGLVVTSVAVPSVAESPRSTMIVDPKAQIAAITARKRAKMGRVLMLNPFSLFEDDLPHLKSHGFNPLGALDPNSDRFVDEARRLSEATVQTDNDHQPHLPKAARNLIAALAMWVRRKWERNQT